MATKKPAPAKKTKPNVNKSKKISAAHQLAWHALNVVWRHKGLFAGIVAMYGLLNILFVTGLGVNVNISDIKNAVANQFAGTLAAYTQLLGSATSAPNQAAGVYQIFLFIFVSLALIWALRQIYANQVVRVRDAYYRGTGPIIPYLLVVAVIGLQLLPMVIGSAAYQLVTLSGIASSGIEIGIWLVVALLLSTLSIYWICSSIMALIIVTLPDMAPVAALKLASKLVTGRRWLVLRKLLFLPLALLAVTAIILLPVIFLVPFAASLVLLLIGPILIGLSHSYIYALYRELMND